jgi:hypothetical protein
MKRILVALSLCTCFVGCGGAKGSPTSPSTPTPQQASRVIALQAILEFGDVSVGGSAERFLRISNNGTGPLTITGLSGPSGYVASWTSGTIQASQSQEVTIRFQPTEAKTYNGTLTVNGDQTSGTNTTPVSGRGQRELYRKSGSGDTVFDMPTDVSRIHVVGTYTGYSSNFIVKVGGRLLVNELLGTGWSMTRYDGTLLTTGGVVAITNSSGVNWSFEEVR